MAVEVRGVLLGVTGVPSLPGVPVEQTLYISKWTLLHIHKHPSVNTVPAHSFGGRKVR